MSKERLKQQIKTVAEAIIAVESQPRCKELASKQVRPQGMCGSGNAINTKLEEFIDQLWLYSTHEEDPWTVDRAFAAIRDDGAVAIEALIWALGEKDLDLLILALRLVREFGEAGKRALPAVEKCLLDERRLVRLTAGETLRLQTGT